MPDNKSLFDGLAPPGYVHLTAEQSAKIRADFKEQQRQRHQQVLERRRKERAAFAAGDAKALGELPPLYE